MLRNAVILGGLGRMGSLLGRSLEESGVSVTRIDLRAPVSNDVTMFGTALTAAIAASDCVCVCLPEKVTLEIADRLAAAMPDGSLWVDTLSLKSEIVRTLEKQGGRIQILSLNPLFAPAMGWAGGTVAIVEVFAGSKSAYWKELLSDWGARLEKVSAEEHDRLTAGVQVATHAAVLAFGAALLRLDFDLDGALRVATPPHRLLLTLLYRMTTQSAGVYRDIQAYHPFGGRVRGELMYALECMQTDIEKDDAVPFEEMFVELKTLFEGKEELFTRWAKQAFALRP